MAGLLRAGGVLEHQDRWVALMVGVMLTSTAVGLWWLVAHAGQVGLSSHLPLAVTAASAYTALAVLVAGRRRIDRPAGAVIVTTLAALMLLEGTTYPDPSLRWVCLAFLTVLPLLAVVLLGRNGAVLATAACVVIAVTIAAGLPGTPQVRTYVASTMASLVCVPVLVVGVLLAQVRRARTFAHTAATTDQLTGLLNRRGLLEALPGLLGAPSPARHVSLTLVDLDHFKAVNDGWGHAAGDQVLVRAAQVLLAATRSGDLLVRHGGEEIVWVARHHEASGAVVAAERVRAALAAAGVGDEELPVVTASFGVAVSEQPPLAVGDESVLRGHLDALLRRADAALYRAKDGGRDRVEVDDEVDASPGQATSSTSSTSATGAVSAVRRCS